MLIGWAGISADGVICAVGVGNPGVVAASRASKGRLAGLRDKDAEQGQEEGGR